MTAETQAPHQFYRNGECCEYTGNSQQLHGATFYEFRIVADSHRVGFIGVTQEAPPTSFDDAHELALEADVLVDAHVAAMQENGRRNIEREALMTRAELEAAPIAKRCDVWNEDGQRIMRDVAVESLWPSPYWQSAEVWTAERALARGDEVSTFYREEDGPCELVFLRPVAHADRDAENARDAAALSGYYDDYVCAEVERDTDHLDAEREPA